MIERERLLSWTESSAHRVFTARSRRVAKMRSCHHMQDEVRACAEDSRLTSESSESSVMQDEVRVPKNVSDV